MVSLSPESIRDFQDTIYSNYRESGRSFPWRETKDPYRILVSEIMLQQTQTDRVVPKYLDWLDRFPNLQALAEAPFQDVLERWIGLGYNRRARYLQEACKKIADEYAGEFPREARELEKLPGIGKYTSAAVSTFAFGIPNAFIETNIRAVFLFFFFKDETDVHDADIMEAVEATMDRADPRSWYYALMDYGSSLKKRVVNPNRKSRHYAKQSRFSGSLRQARGAIIRHLGKKGNATLQTIATAEGLPFERIEEAARSLVSEGMVAEAEGIYGIS
ncbi:MAG TPA: A/G-specific adenine glycosylase [Treponemataceae bacterium]|nr:A/G-specific adenine glycosylase [Treponemataceae bacterium]HPS44059.1 A/G-specific adenine glycosylase [Treponemataceae bacterium]